MDNSDAPPPSLPADPRAQFVGLLVDLGSQRRKQIKRLKRGDGRLTRQLQAVVEQSRAELGIDPTVEIVPVVLLYRQTEPDYVVLTPQP
jgi:hypothetical protein